MAAWESPVGMLRGLVGEVAGYHVVVVGDTVTVDHGERLPVRLTVAGLGSFLARARDLSLGWASLPDFDVIYVYDKGDSMFGYAVNVEATDLSEWGYAPFAP